MDTTFKIMYLNEYLLDRVSPIIFSVMVRVFCLSLMATNPNSRVLLTTSYMVSGNDLQPYGIVQSISRPTAESSSLWCLYFKHVMLGSLLHSQLFEDICFYRCFLLFYFVASYDGWMRWRGLGTCLGLSSLTTDVLRCGCGGAMVLMACSSVGAGCWDKSFCRTQLVQLLMFAHGGSDGAGVLRF